MTTKTPALTLAHRKILADLIVRFAERQVMLWKDGAALTVDQAAHIANRLTLFQPGHGIHASILIV